MPPKRSATSEKSAAKKRAATKAEPPTAEGVVTNLRKLASTATRDGMARFGIPSDNALGVTMADMKQLAKRLGKNHALAADLWKSGWYEARMLASLIDAPAQVTPAQMDRWRRDFDNWAICDTVCFHLFDRTPHAFRKIAQWRNERDEFGRRAAFALLACVALHDKQAADEPFVEGLMYISEAATDERNFVKKAVNWALRAIGGRNESLHAAAMVLARGLAESPDPTARWNGKDALRELTRKKSRRASGKK